MYRFRYGQLRFTVGPFPFLNGVQLLFRLLNMPLLLCYPFWSSFLFLQGSQSDLGILELFAGPTQLAMQGTSQPFADVVLGMKQVCSGCKPEKMVTGLKKRAIK